MGWFLKILGRRLIIWRLIARLSWGHICSSNGNRLIRSWVLVRRDKIKEWWGWEWDPHLALLLVWWMDIPKWVLRWVVAHQWEVFQKSPLKAHIPQIHLFRACRTWWAELMNMAKWWTNLTRLWCKNNRWRSRATKSLKYSSTAAEMAASIINTRKLLLISARCRGVRMGRSCSEWIAQWMMEILIRFRFLKNWLGPEIDRYKI